MCAIDRQTVCPLSQRANKQVFSHLREWTNRSLCAQRKNQWAAQIRGNYLIWSCIYENFESVKGEWSLGNGISLYVGEKSLKNAWYLKLGCSEHRTCVSFCMLPTLIPSGTPAEQSSFHNSLWYLFLHHYRSFKHLENHEKEMFLKINLEAYFLDAISHCDKKFCCLRNLKRLLKSSNILVPFCFEMYWNPACDEQFWKVTNQK